jgi:hypothetical protein
VSIDRCEAQTAGWQLIAASTSSGLTFWPPTLMMPPAQSTISPVSMKPSPFPQRRSIAAHIGCRRVPRPQPKRTVLDLDVDIAVADIDFTISGAEPPSFRFRRRYGSRVRPSRRR